MGAWDLQYPPASKVGEGQYEPVETGEARGVEPHPLGEIGPEGLEAAVLVHHGGVQVAPNDEHVVDLGYQLPVEAVLTSVPPAGHHVPALPDPRHQVRDLLGLVLPVRVHDHRDLPPGCVETRAYGPAPASVALVVDGHHPRVLLDQPGHRLGRTVLRAVLDADDLAVHAAGVVHFEDVPDQGFDVVLLVVDHEDRRDVHHQQPPVGA